MRGRPTPATGRARWRPRRSGQRSRAEWQLSIGAAALVGSLALTLFLANALSPLELGSVDGRFSIRPQPPRPHDVAVVAIDAKTFSDLNLRWPFPRARHAAVIDRLRHDGARAIVVDVQFTEPSDVRNDNALFESIRRTPRIVLATTEVASDGSTRVLGGGDALRASGATVGNAVFPNDQGGTIRRMTQTTQGLISLPVAAAQLALGRRVDPGELGGPSAWIDYRGPPGAILTRSYSTVINGTFAPGTFRNRVVIIGPSAPSLQDVHPTSTSGSALMSGAEIQANAVWTALHDFPLRPSSRWLGAIVVLLMGIAAPVAYLVLEARPASAVLALLGLGYAVAAQLLFDGGTIVPLVYPLVALGLGVVSALGVLIVTGAFERERVRDLFSRFVPESVVREVLAKVNDDLRLGGERRVATILFCDLRGFTTYSESHSPDEVLAVLNRYLTAMSDVILDHGGTLAAYLGDGILAVFGAPLDQEDHADRALSAAREMVGPALQAFNAWMVETTGGAGFKMGVGINTGEVMSGNVGSQRRLEYSVIGDTVNTASRLEGLTKGTNYPVFAAASTQAMLSVTPDDLVHVDNMPIRGRQERLSVWGIRDPAAASPPTDADSGGPAAAVRMS